MPVGEIRMPVDEIKMPVDEIRMPVGEIRMPVQACQSNFLKNMPKNMPGKAKKKHEKYSKNMPFFGVIYSKTDELTGILRYIRVYSDYT